MPPENNPVDAAGTLGFRPTLDISGPVDSAVPDDIAPEALAVLREALSNVARHSEATDARVSVRTVDGLLIVSVQDDGIGTDPDRVRGGLANLTDRARDLGGTFTIRPGAARGTLIQWQVPLDRPADPNVQAAHA